MTKSRHNDGEEVRDDAGSSPLIYKVISANNSFISSTLTILNPVGINGSTIRCNGQSLTMYSFNHSKFSLKPR